MDDFRYYDRPNGTKVPSVTTVLSNVFPKPALVNWQIRTAVKAFAQGKGKVTQKDACSAPDNERNDAAFVGTLVHSLFGMDSETLATTRTYFLDNEEVTNLIDSIFLFREEFGEIKLLKQELVLSNDFFGGTLDYVMDMGDGGYDILDLKTTRFPSPTHRLQISAYWKLFTDEEKNNPLTRKTRGYILYLSKYKPNWILQQVHPLETYLKMFYNFRASFLDWQAIENEEIPDIVERIVRETQTREISFAGMWTPYGKLGTRR